MLHSPRDSAHLVALRCRVTLQALAVVLDYMEVSNCSYANQGGGSQCRPRYGSSLLILNGQAS
jgi:hypothetical protein